MKDKKISKKIIYGIDLILIIGSIVALMFVIGYAKPLVIAPLDGEVTQNSSVLFEFEKGGLILIDDNPEFSSPEEIYVENNLVVNLKPGHYYWKVKGVIISDVREFTILSEVNLKLRDAGEKYEVVNAGNVELDVKIHDAKGIVGNVVLDVDESKEVSGTKFVGEQNG